MTCLELQDPGTKLKPLPQLSFNSKVEGTPHLKERS